MVHRTMNLVMDGDVMIMGIRDADKIRHILNIPETETIVSVIAVGKPAEEPLRPKRKDIAEIAKFF